MTCVIIIVLLKKENDMQNEFDRWNEKVNRIENNCWEWTGATYRRGYGHFRRKINGKWIMYKAHRFSYEYFKNQGELIDSSKLICHSCDNPQCVNPEHLFIGTVQDNINDKLKKGRHRSGCKQGHRMLSDTDVLKIKNEYATGKYSMKEVAQLNNTSAAQVCRIVNNQIHRKVGTEN